MEQPATTTNKELLWAPYWGKAMPDPRQTVNWHPLVYHCLDVASVGAVLLAEDRKLQQSLERVSGAKVSELAPWIVFFLALHDLGKFSTPFQQQSLVLTERLRGPRPIFPSDIRHDRLGYWLYNARFRDWFHEHSKGLVTIGGKPLRRDSLDVWWMAVTGHHGRPPDTGGDGIDVEIGQRFGREGMEAAQAFAEAIWHLIAPRELSIASRAAVPTTSWVLAGLAVLADWLGSNQTYFPYRSSEPPVFLPLGLDAYWEYTQRQARQAIKEAGLLPARSAPLRTLHGLFPRIKIPSPLQQLCSEIPLAQGPQIFLIEDATGSGKTEAALMLSHRMIEAGHVDGFYMAMPTMATSNGMYPRVAAVIESMFAERPSLVLAHSSAKLAQRLQQQEQGKLWKHREGTEQAPAAEATDEGGRGDTATRHAAAWLSDGAKKALLAPVGVGTIDQALLGALPANHSPLRLLGLHRKVLLVDEVHACDVYMSALLDQLLAFQASLGGSVILLSATLALGQRERLLNAFLRPLGGTSSVTSRDYPALVHGCSTGSHPHEVSSSKRSERDVGVAFLTKQGEVHDLLLETAARGGCTAWVRNTVTDAIEAYEQLCTAAAARPEQIEVLLFHARFALGDRLAIEEQVLRRFGPESTGTERARTILVATQVIEQSLDLDFDELVSDLAPVDLLIQRAGRLRRHRRTKDGRVIEEVDPQGQPTEEADVRGRPILHVLAPTWSDDPDPSWLTASPLKRSALVYPALAHLWRTADILRARQALRIPAEARLLVEAVYGLEAKIPEKLDDPQAQYEMKEQVRESEARFIALRPETGYSRDLKGSWQSDTIARTRLGDATSRVRLAVLDADKLRPLITAPEQPAWVSWALSEVTVRADLIATENPAEDALIKQAKKEMSDEGRFVVLLVMHSQGDHYTGQALGQRGGGHRLMNVTYNRHVGLQVTEVKGV